MAGEPKSIKVYRAIWGEAIQTAEGLVFRQTEGVSDENLSRNGIFCLNRYAESRGKITTEADLRWYEHHPSLPVFLNRERAYNTVTQATYPRDLPVLAEAEIPYSLLFGHHARLKLVQNSPSSEFIYEVTQEIADEIKTADAKDSAEFRLEPREGYTRQEFVTTLRSLEHLYRPKKIDREGRVVLEEGFEEVKPSNDTLEGRREINLA